eukprot:6491495-Amphidinium_carterae.6
MDGPPGPPPPPPATGKKLKGGQKQKSKAIESCTCVSTLACHRSVVREAKGSSTTGDLNTAKAATQAALSFKNSWDKTQARISSFLLLADVDPCYAWAKKVEMFEEACRQRRLKCSRNRVEPCSLNFFPFNVEPSSQGIYP